MNFDTYRKAEGALPETYKAWQVFGAGFENVGKEGQMQTLPLRAPNADEILVRVDALGLCLSDIKIITQGSAHPRLRNRDLANDPTVLGHECSVTVVGVGEQWKDSFRIGERFIVQADIYFQGLGYAFGYLIPGGMGQYCYFDERVLAGDEGCYLLPVQDKTGYSEAALAEPWACVEMSYRGEDRLPSSEGNMLIVTDDDAVQWKTTNPFAVVVGHSLEGLGDEVFDDIIVDSPTPEIVTTLAARLRKNGAMFLLGTPGVDGTARLDVGRMHYETIRFYGGGKNVDAMLKSKRVDLKPQGTALFVGAGGPMGQMHVQRALERADGPQRVVVTDLDAGRLEHIQARFSALAKQRNVELITLGPSAFANRDEMDASLKGLAPKGYDDIVILAPVPKLVEWAMGLAADEALVNVFAGLGVGTMADIRVSDLCRGIKICGSSGSRISDLRHVLQLVESAKLSTNLSVAAIGGLEAARAGLEAVKEGRYPGKTVIYPQILELPLMGLDEVPEKIPQLKDTLSPEGAWTNEAERTLLELYV